MSTILKRKTLAQSLIFVLLLPLLAACAAAPAVSAPTVPADSAPAAPVEPTPTVFVQTEPTLNTEPVEPAEIPVTGDSAATMILAGEPLNEDRTLEDIDGSLRAYEKRALSGDVILDNRYERPFTQSEMIYLPDVDIQTVKIEFDEEFFYFTLEMRGVDFGTGTFTAAYGVEFDRNQDGRGDLLVWATDPQTDWSADNLQVYIDKNGNVGGLKPMVAEAGMAGDGYETSVELGGDKAAYARISPEDPTAVQISVSKALMDNPESFLWGAWADKDIKDPSKFDYNDAFGPGEAGSPIKPSLDYPVKALHSMDNTCRLPFGAITATGIPGMCKSIPKVEKDGKTCYCSLGADIPESQCRPGYWVCK